MIHLFNLLLIGLLLLGIAGLTLWVAHLTRLPYGLAKSVTIVGGCLIFFFIEHFLGLGPLGWLLPVAVVGAVLGIWKHHALLREGQGAEIAFLGAFGYALFWRYFFPDIDPQSEKLADLNFIAGYMSGAKLPAPDPWMYGYTLTQYYSFQHYAAGLLGRIMNVPPGMAYNLAFCVIPGLVIAAAYDWISIFVAGRCTRTLILAALLIGGTGACVVSPWMVKNEQTFSSMRFIGGMNSESNETLTPAGIKLREWEYGPEPMSPERREQILEMPMEIFSYVVHLGDYHAPLGGYVLLAAALAAFGVLLCKPEAVPRRWATGILAGSVPLCLAVNTWVFPLQALLVAFCIFFLAVYRERPHWYELAAVSSLTWLLLFPYFTYFLNNAAGAKPGFVGLDQHAPLISWLLQMWPVLGLTTLTFFSPAVWRSPRRQYLWFPLLMVVLLLFVETVTMHDIYVGRFARFNTTLKWWPWVAALSILLLAPLNLMKEPTAQRAGNGRQPKHQLRASIWRRALAATAPAGTVVILLTTLYYARMLGWEWQRRLKPNVGALDGTAWFRKAGQYPNSTNLTLNASILNYLLARPGGVTLEPILKDERGAYRMAFCEMGAPSLFTRHPTVIGWASHEQLWRNYQHDVADRWVNAVEFYSGNMQAPLEFLDAYNVRFILWPGSQPVDATLFQRIKAQIEAHYRFVRFDQGQPMRGIWERKDSLSVRHTTEL